MNTRQAFMVATLAVLIGTLPTLSHAQTIGWVDRLFTFRKDQKPSNGGSRAQMPNVITQPFYSPNDHVAWSDFYTRPDLTAQDAMIGSASKVMREPAPQMAATEYDTLATRALENARAERASNIQIGEPGEGAGMQAGDSRTGAGTRVGAPINDWRTQADPRLTARPGDYDYQGGNTLGGGEVLTETAPKFSLPMVVPPSGSANTTDNGVTSYQVQRGDSLGSIAAQPTIYNEAALWPLIYSANRKAVGGNPHAISPGMDLTIPRDYTPEQAKQARKRAGRR